MSPMLADPFDELLRLRELFYELFGRSLPDLPVEQQNNWVIPVDVYRTSGAVIVECDVPGARVEDISLEVRQGRLLIEGESRAGEPPGRVHRLERRRGRFSRSIELPPDVEVEHIQASMSKGVLKVSLPLRGAGQPRKVPVAAADN